MFLSSYSLLWFFRGFLSQSSEGSSSPNTGATDTRQPMLYTIYNGLSRKIPFSGAFGIPCHHACSHRSPAPVSGFEFQVLSWREDFQGVWQSRFPGGFHVKEIPVAGDQGIRADGRTQRQVGIVFRIPADRQLLRGGDDPAIFLEPRPQPLENACFFGPQP